MSFSQGPLLGSVPTGPGALNLTPGVLPSIVPGGLGYGQTQFVSQAPLSSLAPATVLPAGIGLEAAMAAGYVHPAKSHWHHIRYFLWFVIVLLIAWIIIYSMKPKGVQNADGSVNPWKVLLWSVIIAIVVIIIIALIFSYGSCAK